jgi:hypothetical protein
MDQEGQDSVGQGTIHGGSGGLTFGERYRTFRFQTPKIRWSRYQSSIGICRGPRLPNCRICSAIVETSGHQYARSHSWFAISRAVPWSCIQSGELEVADSLQSWTGMRKGCYLLDIDVSQARGEEGQRFRCTYASTTHPGSPIDDTLKTLATVCNSTSSATTLSLSSPATATAALAACQLLASPCIEFNWGMWGTARIWRRWTLHSSYHQSKLYCSGCTSPCV